MNDNKYRDSIKKQLIDSHGKVLYTYTAHWKIVDRLKKNYMRIIIVQIILTAISAAGIVSSLVTKVPSLGWLSGVAASISLGINLYMLNFNLPDEIKQHSEAANELWEIRELYSDLLTDFDVLDDESIRNKRDKLTKLISKVNKTYPGTDKKSYKDAQKALKEEEEQSFSEGEAERLIHSGVNSKTDNSITE